MSFSLLSSSYPPKRSIIKRFPVLFPLGVFLAIFLGYQALNQTDSSSSIGVVEVNGVILESESVIKKLRTLEGNPRIQGIIVRINSPGGAVSPAQEIYSEVLRINKSKKVYASVSSAAASGGYYIAIAAEKLFANPGSMVGSIGVIIQTFNVEGLMDKIGIESIVVKSGKNKDIGTMFRPMNPEERSLLDSVVSDTHDQFIEAVAKRRSLELEKTREIADGRVFTGKQAKEIGLIDHIASFRETAEQMKNDLNLSDDVKLFYPADKKEILESLLDVKSLLGFPELTKPSGLYYLATSLLGNH